MQNVQDSLVKQIMLAQDLGIPAKVYRKVIVGKVCVKMLDPFSGQSTEVLIEGDPKTTSPADLEISLWTSPEVRFFEKLNRGLIENGSLVVAEGKTEDPVDFTNALSDEELEALVTDRFFTFKKALLEITSETTAQRILKAAERMNRPVATMNLIRDHIESLQQGE